MKKRKSNSGRILLLLALALALGALLALLLQFAASHFFVGGKAYARDVQVLDLRDRELSWQDYDEIRAQLPDAVIRWQIPFQGNTYPDDTEQLSVSSLYGSDLNALAYFQELKAVDATACRDYDQLQKLMDTYPHLQVDYVVTIGGQDYPKDTRSLVCATLTQEDIAMMAWLPELQAVDTTGCQDYDRIAALAQACPQLEISYHVEILGQTFTEADTEAVFQDPDMEILEQKLAALPNLQTVQLGNTSASAEALLALTQAYPEKTILWEKTIFGQTHSSDETEFDFSGMAMDNTWELEAAMAWFPNAEKVILSDCGLDNETLAAFREKMREDYKVVWTVYVTKKPVRTDQTVIHSSAMGVCLIDEQSFDLKYCEDAIVVDIGHSYVKDISWVEGMPNLKYLIIADNWLKDLTPISSCKNLIYLELFDNKYVPDYTPLLGCTALVDLNISGTYADLEPLKQMTWLETLWCNCCGMTQAEYDELSEALPNTHIEYRGGDYTTLGWREVQGYYDMRDIMGLPYNVW